jgi:hypothetical protein
MEAAAETEANEKDLAVAGHLTRLPWCDGSAILEGPSAAWVEHRA